MPAKHHAHTLRLHTHSITTHARHFYCCKDFYKAFDKVSHHYLQLTLESNGIKNSVLQWMSSFLHGCTQRAVSIDSGSTSDPVNVTSAVPQGTVLGPLLFLIYINDLPECISSSCSLFADDCLLYRKIETDNDRWVLQQELYNVELWARKWLMTFNVDKCVIVQISLKPQCETSYNPLQQQS